MSKTHRISDSETFSEHKMSKTLTYKQSRLFFNKNRIPGLRNTLVVILSSKHLGPSTLKAALSVFGR